MEPEDELPAPIELEVEVWYASVPEVGNPLLADVLREELLHVEAVDDALVISHETLLYADETGSPAWGRTVIEKVAQPVLPSTEFAGWEGADAALAEARGALRVREEIPAYVDAPRRVAALHAVLGVLGSTTSPIALSWSVSGAVTPPADPRPLAGFVNLRSQPDAEVTGGRLVDTLGLTAFHIPDVECHYVGLDDALVRDEVHTHATRMLSGQEFIADGDPVMAGELWFTARYAMASGQPERRVVALVPPAANAINPPPEPEVGDDDDGLVEP